MFIKHLSFLLLLLSTTLFAQRNVTDSIFFAKALKTSAKFHTNNDFKKAAYFFSKKNWDSTLVYSQKSINEENKDYCYLFRGISFYKKKVNQEAIDQLNLISPDFIFNSRVKSFLSALYIKQKNFKKAIDYLKDLEALPDDNNDAILKSYVYKDLGLCYLFLKEYDKSEAYLQQSINTISDTTELIKNYTNYANLYYNQYKDDLAIAYFTKSYDLAQQYQIKEKNVSATEKNDLKNKLYEQRRRTSKNMSVVEENRKNYKKALQYRKEMEKWKDSINDQNRIYEVAQKEKEFAVAAKQKEVDFLTVQNELKETQRKLYLYSVLGLLLLLGIGAYFFREKVKANKIIAAQKETLDQLNTTKDKLFSIVSHDLRSSVNALKSSNKVLIDNLASKNLDALENLLQKNSAIVNGAYGLLDNLLNWALLQTEQQYFHIDQQRLFIITEHVAYNYTPLFQEKNLNFENTVSKKAMVLADQESLKIILRNLIDNAIKFSKENGSITIYSANSIEGYCDLIVEDTGLGMSEATREKLLDDSVLLNKKEHEDIIGTGLGLQLIKSMIKKNHGKFNIISELGKGTKMIVSLPKSDID